MTGEPGGQEPSPRALAVASVLRALLGELTPDLRAVAVRVTPDEVRARFVYEPGDAAGRERAEETVDDVEAEMMADYLDDVVGCVAEFSDAPRLELGSDEFWVLRRREPSSP